MGFGGDSRRAVIELYADGRQLDGALATSGSKVRKWGQRVSADVKGAMRGAFDSMKGVAGFAGIAGIAVATREVLEFETGLTRLGISAGRSAAEMDVLRSQIFAIAKARGISADDLLGGARKFVELTGDLDTAKGSLDTFAEVAQASGASMEDIAAAAAGLKTNLHLGAGEMKSAFGILLMQGKAGAVELRDMARLAASLTPQFSNFKTQGVPALNEMGAALQIVRTGFGSTEEAATGLEGLMSAIRKRGVQMQRAGVHVFDVDKQGVHHLRDFKEIVFDLIRVTKGDPIKLQKLLGRQEAYQALNQFAQRGEKAFDDLLAAGEKGSAQIDQDFKRMSETPAFKMAQAKAQISQTFNSLLAKNLDTIAHAFQAIADAIKWIGDHPGTAMALLAAFKGGGYLQTLGMGAGGGAMGGSGGLGGGKVAGGNLAARVGGAVQGGLVSYGVMGALGGGGPAQAFAGLAGAATQLSGSFGLVGVAATGAALGIQAVFGYLDSQIQKRENQILKGEYGSFGAREGLDFKVGLRAHKALDTDYTGMVGLSDANRARFEAQAREGDKSGHFLLRHAAAEGAAKVEGEGKDAKVALNEEILRSSLGRDQSLTEGQRAAIFTATKEAVELANSTGQGGFRGQLADIFGKGALGPTIKVEVQVGMDPVTGNVTVEQYKRAVRGRRRAGK